MNPIHSQGREEGIPWVWVTGGSLTALILLLIVFGIIILVNGLTAFWPSSIAAINDPAKIEWGTIVRVERKEDGSKKALVFTGNHDLTGEDFRYVDTTLVSKPSTDDAIWFVERLEWGPFIGRIIAVNNQPMNSEMLSTSLEASRKRRDGISDFESREIRPINVQMEKTRLEVRSLQRMQANHSSPSDISQQLEESRRRLSELTKLYDEAAKALLRLRSEDAKHTITLETRSSQQITLPLSSVVRAFVPNRESWLGKLGIYGDRLWEFVTAYPREANTAGGIFPVIFGTVVLTLLMTAAVLPFGVLAAVFIREIAAQGTFVSIVRIAVGNLAGVPSIVYGVFGLGFFCYTIGASVDQLFFSDKLPTPTFGTGGILWASLTLALLTVPVVIVSTEEALAAVPRTLREASYGCGATRLQTLMRVVIPKAIPGIMTGMILAMARGMGEVAPLIMTGVVKLAPALPIDSVFPYIHLDRSFMHLGFHIYDLGFQSRSAEATRPLVFASTLLLITLVLALNLTAIRVRSRLRKRFEGRGAF